MDERTIRDDFERAVDRYADLGVDARAAAELLGCVPLSLHCWQGDDVRGFEPDRAGLSGGLAVTGRSPGRARTIGELQADLERAYALIPGRHRLNLHAIYGDYSAGPADRDRIEPSHFEAWAAWADGRLAGIDFNATCFSHPLAASGWTLASLDPGVRAFWIEHIRRCRAIAAWLGGRFGNPSLHNLWLPDGDKDRTCLRARRRELLIEGLDAACAEDHPAGAFRDAVEGKLFGIGSEAFVAGSHELYLCWALKRGAMPCLDLGHFHPTESVADKITALLPFFPELLIHLSRPLRWDSDHVPVGGEDLDGLMEEIVRARALARVRLATDFFDGSLDQVGAWVAGARASLYALLCALLQPLDRLVEAEREGDRLCRLALLEESRRLPAGAVWNHHCLTHGVPAGADWITEAGRYRLRVAAERG